MTGGTNNDDWVSVSEMARLSNVSKQTVYNRVRDGFYVTRTFKRGKMKGILICVPRNTDEHGKELK